MGRNLLGGKKKKRCKNKNTQSVITAKYVTVKEKDQDYVRVSKMLGDGRLLGSNSMRKDILCIIRGKLKKRVWINVGDIILISYRDYQYDKADVILKYNDYEVSELKRIGELNNIECPISYYNKDDDNEECFNFDDI